MEQQTKIITLASFVDEDRIDGFSDYIEKGLKYLKKNYLFILPRKK